MGVTNGRVGLGLIVTAAAWAVALLANRSARDVVGTSMLPALAPGDRLLVVRVPRRWLRRGDVVVVEDVDRPGRQTIKRVVGLPGETVEVDADGLVVDGVRHREPYVVLAGGATPGGTGELTGGTGELTGGTGAIIDVPAGHVAVLGDNRAASTDSRSYGPVPLSRVVARVAARVRPPGRAPHQAPRPV